MIIIAYHGSNSKFSQFDQGKARIVNDFYGGGVAYFTTDQKVAITYANSMFKSKGGGKYVYKVVLNFKKTFDVDHNFTGKELTKFFDSKDAEDFARGAGLLKAGADRFVVVGNLRSGDMELTGDQVFKGLSRGMVNTAKARAKLSSLGYDSLRYNGGLNMQQAIRHDVYLAYDANDIKIDKTYRVADKKPTAAQEPRSLVAESVLNVMKETVRNRNYK